MKRVKLRGIPKDAKKIYHFYPYAYCVAKPAIFCAVFAVAPQKNRLTGLPYEEWESVHHKSVQNIQVGQWYSLAYCNFGSRSELVAVVHQPNFKIGKRTWVKP